MKKYYIVDISGKIVFYDRSLFNAMQKRITDESLKLFFPGNGLLSLIPRCFLNKGGIIKKFFKACEGLLNYIYICYMVTVAKPDIIHLQWLPFMDVIGWETWILKLIKKLSPKSNLVLTIHNVYPHNMNQDAKKAYNIRFRQVCSNFDAFIVHTLISKNEVIQEFALQNEKVYVCCHGVFEPQNVQIISEKRKKNKLHILQFGVQSYYKGTDILVEAICGLDDKRKSEIETHISGGIDHAFLKELKAKDKNSIIHWKSYILSDEELYQQINNSDIIVLPYRTISQSGVLLLSIYFEKLIICSDLPSFKETMHGEEGDNLDTSIFFKSGDAISLRNLIIRYIDGKIDEDAIRKRIIHLKSLYSWENAAITTTRVYDNISADNRTCT